MLSIKLQGGLGNQLFMIFATIAHAMKYKQLVIFSKHIDNDPNTTPRHTYWDTILAPLRYMVTMKKIIFKVYTYPNHHYVKISPHKGNYCLNGYFQSYKYFQKYQEQIYTLLKLHTQRMKIKQHYIEYFRMHSEAPIENIISLHFRMGDYKLPKFSGFHNIITMDYYIAAIREIINQLKNRHLAILCFGEKQDTSEINKKIAYLQKIFPTCLFHLCDPQIPDWQQLLLMSCCQHHIIANSSFSWWGAYINDYPKKIICYPERWFGPLNQHLDTKDMFPSNWKCIKDNGRVG